jgi:hypothetical protein
MRADPAQRIETRAASCAFVPIRTYSGLSHACLPHCLSMIARAVCSTCIQLELAAFGR